MFNTFCRKMTSRTCGAGRSRLADGRIRLSSDVAWREKLGVSSPHQGPPRRRAPRRQAGVWFDDLEADAEGPSPARRHRRRRRRSLPVTAEEALAPDESPRDPQEERAVGLVVLVVVIVILAFCAVMIWQSVDWESASVPHF